MGRSRFWPGLLGSRSGLPRRCWRIGSVGLRDCRVSVVLAVRSGRRAGVYTCTFAAVRSHGVNVNRNSSKALLKC